MFIDSATPIEVQQLNANEFLAFDIDEHLEQISLTTQLVIYDLAEIKILNCMQINQLISLKKEIDAQGMKMAMTGVTDNLAQIFDILQIHMIIDIYPSRESAINVWKFDHSPTESTLIA